jgi:hypothetical protein
MDNQLVVYKARKRGTDALLEGKQVTLCEGIRLCNDRDEIDAGTETLHDLNIEGLETVTKLNSWTRCLEGYGENVRVPGWPDKVQAGVNTKVALLAALRLLLLNHVGLVLVVNKVDNGGPRVAVVDIVTKAGSVDDGELDLELLFFELSLDNLDFGELVELFVVASVVVFGRR